ncbi:MULTISPECIES: peptidylprolyl isomerase [Pseudomonas]|uniref:peptidylprolyl isomerase n=1 Tax=Pseudomonas juntendi TaxID=2666183 RepID=A0ABD4YI44_9PSED|nr:MULTISPECIES: peptidylprolyl isomerase [Pseudomonas]MDH0759186.1 peptidylprolyl isomerase [Pseudomonas juntendi]MDH1575432.1 peptidylprolyl isomerase [Pseudomonas sp. GD03746]MDH1919934.1 peptidylprolyl isomerase [Pseudomonas juntendi]QUN68628.1 peptidylprolyl isomerase [Pseudomonas sp. JS425]
MSALNPRVVIETAMGTFAVLLHADRAPLTVANFLAYVDSGRYDGSSIFRIVNPANQEPADPVRISVIHGGTRPLAASNLSMIPLETTQKSGLQHRHGTLSMGRDEPNSAEGDFFVCIGDQPHFDYGGARQPDGMGFAAFGEVYEGMAVVEAIFAAAGPTEYLAPEAEIRILRAYRRA